MLDADDDNLRGEKRTKKSTEALLVAGKETGRAVNGGKYYVCVRAS